MQALAEKFGITGITGETIEAFVTKSTSSQGRDFVLLFSDISKPLVDIAKAGQETTVFMELRNFRPTSGDHILFQTGSLSQPYQLFIPNGNSGGSDDVMKLLLNRYVAEGESKPRRSYAFVTGPTKMFPDNDNGRPEIIVTDPAQITDWPNSALERAISAVTP